MLASMTMNIDLARVAWQARDHMYRAAGDVRAARDALRGAEEHMGWRSRAAERFAARAGEVLASADGLAHRCDIAADTLLSIGNYVVTT